MVDYVVLDCVCSVVVGVVGVHDFVCEFVV